jgi:hypothetical protein
MKLVLPLSFARVEFKVLGVNLNAIIIECCKIDAIFIM